MLTANSCASLRSGWDTKAQLEVHVVSCCAVCNVDFTVCVSVCQLVLVCTGYDLKLPTRGHFEGERVGTQFPIVKMLSGRMGTLILYRNTWER